MYRSARFAAPRRLVGDGPVVLLVAVARPLRISMVCATVGSWTLIGWKRRRRGVLLEVLAVLVECGRADGLELTAASIGLRMLAASIAFGGTAPTSVQLVDEQDDVAARGSPSGLLRAPSKSPR